MLCSHQIAQMAEFVSSKDKGRFTISVCFVSNCVLFSFTLYTMFKHWKIYIFLIYGRCDSYKPGLTSRLYLKSFQLKSGTNLGADEGSCLT